ncbi:MAG: 2,3-bisphosphoglycerate-independent phosphoglycerate mutase, partial [Prevotella sp.]|nr:2,3-bisphosphoglycerate-independent phosphoglycerate mutase [Prevotella sp.]
SFINGGREEPFAGEDRILVASPKVATYDLKPEMAAFEIKDKLVAAINEDGTPNTAHSLNPVPFIYVTNNNSAKVKNGRLADVAPSILHIMGLEQPADMTGECLIID